MATITTTTTSSGSLTHHPSLNQNLSSRKSSSSDEDIVHTVTNVYQIPVIQQQHSQISILNDSSTKATDLSGLSQIGGITNNKCQNSFNVETLFDGEQIQSKTSSKTFTTSKITHKVIDEQHKPGSVPVKEKYQIRSIVEIYENPSSNETNLIDISKTKKNTTFEETRNYITKKYDDSIDFSYSSKNNKITTDKNQFIIYYSLIFKKSST